MKIPTTNQSYCCQFSGSYVPESLTKQKTCKNFHKTTEKGFYLTGILKGFSEGDDNCIVVLHKDQYIQISCNFISIQTIWASLLYCQVPNLHSGVFFVDSSPLHDNEVTTPIKFTLTTKLLPLCYGLFYINTIKYSNYNNEFLNIINILS